MRLALAQLNPTVGDLRGNAELVRSAAAQARRDGADLLVASELLISGYPPKDLLLREGFVEACDRVIDELAAAIDPELGVVVGHPTRRGLPQRRIGNAASLLFGGTVQATVHKALLPNYDVFDEQRYFRAAQRVAPVEFRGGRLGIHICEDAWWGEPSTFYHQEPDLFPDPVAALAAAGADVLINLSASPFELAKPDRRAGLLSGHVRRHGLPLVFVNQTGGNDDLVFDGHSLVIDASGETVVQLAGFRSDYRIIDLDALPPAVAAPPRLKEKDLLEALTLGLHDYARKSGFTDCVLGLSGGIDSAVACCIAARAVGPQRVHGLLMPSRYSSGHSVSDARELAENLGIDHCVVPIDSVHQAYEATPVVGDDLGVGQAFQRDSGGAAGQVSHRQAGKPDLQAASVADQNLQARIRGAIVMVRSNRYGWLPLATGNKSELAVGYCTLYGDMAGGFAVLADVLKRDVYAVARHINETEGRAVIPENVLTKAPSAELAPGQFDQDTLPPYPLLDGILEGLIEREQSVETLSRQFPAETVRWVAGRLDRNEYKRRQMPPGIKLTQRAFGSGRRMPMAARFDAT